MRLELSESIVPLLKLDDSLDIRADFVPEDEARKRYLHRGFGNSYDFSQSL